jgi:hypothetical protein
MRFNVTKTLLLACALSLAELGVARAAGEPVQQTVAAAEDVSVALCVESGDVSVRGWDRKEVRASATGAARVELRRGDAGEGQAGAARVEVLTAGDGESVAQGCIHTGGGVSVDVPRGSFVQVKSYGGKIAVADVAGARVETLSGDVTLNGVTKLVEATSANGVISLRHSKGRVRLRTISGRIDVADAAASEPGDDFSAKTTSGDISLARVTHSQVEALSANGDVELSGALARGGAYTLRSQTGNVTVTLPEDSSFLLTAKVAEGGEIVTDFPIRQLPKRTTAEGGSGAGGIFNAGRLTGVQAGRTRPTPRSRSSASTARCGCAKPARRVNDATPRRARHGACQGVNVVKSVTERMAGGESKSFCPSPSFVAARARKSFLPQNQRWRCFESRSRQLVENSGPLKHSARRSRLSIRGARKVSRENAM